jgi:hypothetical protein
LLGSPSLLRSGTVKKILRVAVPLAALFAILYVILPANAPSGLVHAQTAQVLISDPCPPRMSGQLPQSKSINITNTTAVVVAPATAAKANYVCAWIVDIAGSATSAGTIQFETGTQTSSPCDTGAVVLTGAMVGNLTAGQPQLIGGDGVGTQFYSPVNTQICAVATGTTISIQGYLTYVQQ